MSATDTTSVTPAETDVAEVQGRLEAAGVRYALAGFSDVHGRLKGKVVPIAHLANMAGGSELFTGAAVDGVPQEINDEEVSAQPDLDRAFVLPWKKDVAYFPSTLYTEGKPFEAGSRHILQRQIAAAAELGLKFNLGIETEFFVLDDGPDGPTEVSDRDTAEKPCYDLTTTLDNFGWLTELVEAMDELGWDVYSFDHEDARGQFEIDFMYADALTMADRVAFFRLMAGEIARKHGHFASFMAKPFADRTGSGAHFNMSLADLDTGANLFAEGDDPHGVGVSEIGYHFIAGILRHAKAISAVIAPTVNSYKRLVRKGSTSGSTWAPVFVSYGDNNRTNMIRVPSAGAAWSAAPPTSAATPTWVPPCCWPPAWKGSASTSTPAPRTGRTCTTTPTPRSPSSASGCCPATSPRRSTSSRPTRCPARSSGRRSTTPSSTSSAASGSPTPRTSRRGRPSATSSSSDAAR
nr:hypothetical protein [Nocardioides houyundeii]